MSTHFFFFLCCDLLFFLFCLNFDLCSSAPNAKPRLFKMVKVKAHELKDKSKADLLKQLDELKKELAQLRVAKVRRLTQGVFFLLWW